MKNRWIVLSIAMLLFFVGYSLLPDPDGHDSHHLMDKIKAANTEFDSPFDGLSAEDSSGLILVHPNNTNLQPFFTEKRIDLLVSHPCSNCHNQPLKTLAFSEGEEIKNSHWNISLAHAPEGTMNCKTCHDKQEMNGLTSLTDEPIMMDESFKLCAQCHSTQHKDWEGGAHGKSQNGWKTPRIIKNCVSCHDPHQPAFPSRFPARLNTRDLAQ